MGGWVNSQQSVAELCSIVFPGWAILEELIFRIALAAGSILSSIRPRTWETPQSPSPSHSVDIVRFLLPFLSCSDVCFTFPLQLHCISSIENWDILVNFYAPNSTTSLITLAPTVVYSLCLVVAQFLQSDMTQIMVVMNRLTERDGLILWCQVWITTRR